jgi:hypothetical protein
VRNVRNIVFCVLVGLFFGLATDASAEKKIHKDGGDYKVGCVSHAPWTSAENAFSAAVFTPVKPNHSCFVREKRHLWKFRIPSRSISLKDKKQ